MTKCSIPAPQPARQWGWSLCVSPYGHGGLCQHEPPKTESTMKKTPGANPLRFPKQHDARHYVYNVIVAMLDAEFDAPANTEGWMFGGIEQEPDRRRLTKAIKAVMREMLRKGAAK